eukprot:TRINITY_DN18394_c0_g1_i1.p1 TRINITY_DN18394_c0_g1~~TRINITY_DN18394_c0_g1_i1.p1  ORF type:complete len:1877 (+),score=386.70 TRINITY_DN18394_c0_g1_i1:87-5717(+)
MALQLSLAVLVSLAAAAPWTEENAAWNINFEPRYEPSSYRGEWPGHEYFPSPPDWRALTIYQLITDRFADGDPRNNELFDGGFDVRDMTFRHGGDFAGLTAKLHYIKGLGCTAIWISPIFQNGFNFYHQYAQLDFTVIDKRLGTLEELRKLTTEAHKLGMYVIIDVVMNHMANEFYFEGFAKAQAPWRFHEDGGKREYKLKPRSRQATYFESNVWCGGEGLWQEFGMVPTGILESEDSCEDRCASDPDCFFFLYKNDLGSLSTYHCAGFPNCDEPSAYTDGKATIFKMKVWDAKAVQVADKVWCGGEPLWQDFSNTPSGYIASQDACEAHCAADDQCQLYLWKDDPTGSSRFHCAGFASCGKDEQGPYDDGHAKIFQKRTRAERHQDGMYDTPAGRQPYADFWYNNTWEPGAKYNGTLYGQWGESVTDQGQGTYDGSDFHHNGDLKDYFDPWQINYGKIYGVMDDLRLEHERVQQKYIAMTKALIESADVDGFRVDTPMQVPLNFYKVWAPAMRAHAKSLGKERFGIFGEFFVTPGRYATMTGRGRDNTMYNQNRFIDDISTLKGGIVYPYYWYMFTAMVYKEPMYADGLPLAYMEENKMIDTYDPTSQRNEYAQWTFCNNHDNWRIQSMTGKAQMRMCLAVITFWPGVPLHYAGDEQDFDTPGSALDGWSREELSVSMAWRAVRTQEGGNPADRDNFDMTAESYRYIARLNALRRAYFGQFGQEECDKIQTPSPAVQDVLIFIRGCNESSKVLVMASFHTLEDRVASTAVPWPANTLLIDSLEKESPTQLEVSSDGMVGLSLRPLQAVAFVPAPVVLVPPAVLQVSPAHGATVEFAGDELEVTLRFDRDMSPSISSELSFDGEAGKFSCSGATCSLTLAASAVGNGHHVVEISEGARAADGSQLFAAFRSWFMVDRGDGVIAKPMTHVLPGLICSNRSQLCHRAMGASWFRAQNVGGNWSDWRPYVAVSNWSAEEGVPVLVQYYSQMSASFVVGDCVTANGRCHASWHKHMYLKGEFNDWGTSDEGSMRLVRPFTWAANVTLSKFSRGRMTPVHDWSKSYGVHPDRELLYSLPDFDPRHFNFNPEPTMSGTEATRKWMLERNLWTENENVASGAEFAQDLWLSHLCTAAPPSCTIPEEPSSWVCHAFGEGQNMDWCSSAGVQGCTEYAVNDRSSEMDSCGGCGCCRKKVDVVPTGPEARCCVLFNDLFLNYTVSSDLSLCTEAPGAMALPPLQNSFLVKVQLDNLTAFQEEAFLAAVTKTLQNQSSSVNITADVASILFKVTSTTEVRNASADVLQDIKDELCFALLESTDSSATCTSIILSGGRRLAGEVTIVSSEVQVENAAGADEVKALAGDAAALEAVIRSSHPNDTVELVVPALPITEVEVMTLVTAPASATSEQTLSLTPETSALTGQLAASLGAPVTVNVESPPTTTSTTSTTTTSSTVSLATTTTTSASSVSTPSPSSSTVTSSACVSFTVKSAGGDDGNFAEFYIDGVMVELLSGRGLSVVVLAQDGSVAEAHVYDTGYQSSGSEPFARLIQGLPTGTPVLVAAMDDASDNLTEEAKAALQSLGAKKEITYRGSYALVGMKGESALAERASEAEKGAVEIKASNSWDSRCPAETSTSTPGTDSISIQVKSAGGDDGNMAEFVLNGERVDLQSGRGLSVVILNRNGAIAEKHVYDTGYEASGAAPFATLISGLPAGTLVLVAAMDDASDNLTEDAKVALESLGATKARRISYRGSYALVGVKGGAALAEEISAKLEGAVEISMQIPLPLGEIGVTTSLRPTDTTSGASAIPSTSARQGSDSTSTAPEPSTTEQPVSTTDVKTTEATATSPSSSSKPWKFDIEDQLSNSHLRSGVLTALLLLLASVAS